DSSLHSLLQFEAEHAAVIPHLAVCNLVIGVRRKSGVIHFFNCGMLVEKFRHCLRVCTMRVHSQLQCFYSLDEKECVEGIRITSEETMRFENRPVHSFEIFSKQDSADCVAVTIQEFGSGMYNEVDSEAKWLLQIDRKRVV